MTYTRAQYTDSVMTMKL